MMSLVTIPPPPRARGDKHRLLRIFHELITYHNPMITQCRARTYSMMSLITPVNALE